MTDITIKEPAVTKFFENFRYDLIKAVVFIIILAASIIYASSESVKYYPESHNSSSLFKK